MRGGGGGEIGGRERKGKKEKERTMGRVTREETKRREWGGVTGEGSEWEGREKMAGGEEEITLGAAGEAGEKCRREGKEGGRLRRKSKKGKRRQMRKTAQGKQRQRKQSVTGERDPHLSSGEPKPFQEWSLCTSAQLPAAPVEDAGRHVPGHRGCSGPLPEVRGTRKRERAKERKWEKH